jgi:hypothetical protein
MKYPEPLHTRSGNKVGWYSYANNKSAIECSLAAIHNAKIKANYGYEFGYCVPGSITQISEGLYEVCIP